MGTVSPLPARWSVLERVLSLFTDVRAGEGVTALLLAGNVFCLLALYSVLKPVRSALIISESGAVAQSYASAGQALLLLVLVPLYGRLASRVGRVQLITVVTLFFASNLLAFSVLGQTGARLGFSFYVWLGIFNLMLPAQLWAFANDVYSSDRGKRLFPIVGVGASLGAWIGAEIASALFDNLGAYRLMLGATGGLGVCLGLTIWIDRRERSRAAADASEAARAPEEPLGRTGGFQLVLSQRYLLYIALLVMVLNIVNTLGEFLLASLVEGQAVAAAAAAGQDTATWIGGFMARFQANVNLLGLLIQLFLVSRIFKYVGVRGALYILPAIAFLSYGAMAFLPVLAVVQVAKTLENSTDYSVQNTTRQALFLPTSREAKYKAKQAIDAFFWRAGDLLQLVVVLIGTALAFGTRHFALVNLGLIVVWFVLAAGIAAEHRKLTASDAVDRAA
jgi:AAA family ATP:ADP antiporter